MSLAMSRRPGASMAARSDSSPWPHPMSRIVPDVGKRSSNTPDRATQKSHRHVPLNQMVVTERTQYPHVGASGSTPGFMTPALRYPRRSRV